MNLVSGLKWSDGSALNATDLEWSLLYGNSTGYFAPYLSSVKVLNTTAVTVTVSSPQPNWLANMENIFVVPHENFGSVALDNISSYTAFTNIVGAGPYILPSYTSGTNPLIMVPNPYYYGGNSQYYSQIAVHIFSSLQSMESAMLAGQINIMWFGGSGQDAQPFQNVAGISVYEFVQTDSYQILNLNYLKAPLNNVDFRQALAYATDRDAISNTVNGPGYNLVNYGGGPTVAPGENTYAVNDTIAKQMFLAAGLKYSGSTLEYANGTQVTLTIQVPTGEPTSANVATLVAQEWANLGINVLTDTTEATSLYADFGTGNWQIASLQEDGTTGTPIRYQDQLQSSDLFLTALAATPGTPATADQYVTSQIGQLILQQTEVPTGSAAFNNLTAQITPLVADQVVMIPFYTSTNINVYSSNINFGSNSTNPNDATGIYNYQTNVQEPYEASTFYFASPLAAGSSTTTTTSSTATTSTSATTSTVMTTSTSSTTVPSTSTTTASSTASSSALSGYVFPVLAIAAVVIAATGLLASSKRRGPRPTLGTHPI
jgi:peptide/nickel transport system substrate-binding protein